MESRSASTLADRDQCQRRKWHPHADHIPHRMTAIGCMNGFPYTGSNSAASALASPLASPLALASRTFHSDCRKWPRQPERMRRMAGFRCRCSGPCTGSSPRRLAQQTSAGPGSARRQEQSKLGTAHETCCANGSGCANRPAVDWRRPELLVASSCAYPSRARDSPRSRTRRTAAAASQAAQIRNVPQRPPRDWPPPGYSRLRVTTTLILGAA